MIGPSRRWLVLAFVLVLVLVLGARPDPAGVARADDGDDGDAKGAETNAEIAVAGLLSSDFGERDRTAQAIHLAVKEAGLERLVEGGDKRLVLRLDRAKSRATELVRELARLSTTYRLGITSGFVSDINARIRNVKATDFDDESKFMGDYDAGTGNYVHVSVEEVVHVVDRLVCRVVQRSEEAKIRAIHGTETPDGYVLIPAGTTSFGSTMREVRHWGEITRWMHYGTNFDPGPFDHAWPSHWEKKRRHLLSEYPRRPLTVASSFYMKVHEVTHEDVLRFVEHLEDGAAWRSAFDMRGKLDVGSVNGGWEQESWTERGAPPKTILRHPFCWWVPVAGWGPIHLAIAGSENAELPTEEQWALAAGGFAGSRFPWGNRIDFSMGYFSDEREHLVKRVGARRHDMPLFADVGSYPQGASPFGVLDMAGNAPEPTISQQETAAVTGALEEGAAVARSREPNTRVWKGGASCYWDRDLLTARVAARYVAPSRGPLDRAGLRLVRAAPAVPVEYVMAAEGTRDD